MISVRANSGSEVMIAAALVLALPLAALAALTPADKCEASKNKTAGAYYSCREKAEATAISKGLPADYSKCTAKFDDKWDGAETKGEGMCPDTVTMTTDINAFIAAQAADAALVIAGAPIPDCAGDLSTCDGDLTTCGGSLATCTGSLGTCNGSLGTCTGNLATANAGTAAVGDVLISKTFTSMAGLDAAGTMPNNGAVTLIPATLDQAIAAGYHDGTGKCAGDADLLAGNIKNGMNLFGVAGTLPVGLLKTGQTLCYNTAGMLIACAGTGQDGESQKGAARSFTDNSDGTVTDNTTGLMWEKQSEDGTIHDKDNSYTWDNAFASKVATLNSTVFAGHNDWRVPNVVELESLKNFAGPGPAVYSVFNTSCVAACTVLTCSCTQSTFSYWSSTTVQPTTTGIAWVVGLGIGSTTSFVKTDIKGVRGVRAGF